MQRARQAIRVPLALHNSVLRCHSHAAPNLRRVPGPNSSPSAPSPLPVCPCPCASSPLCCCPLSLSPLSLCPSLPLPPSPARPYPYTPPAPAPCLPYLPSFLLLLSLPSPATPTAVLVCLPSLSCLPRPCPCILPFLPLFSPCPSSSALSPPCPLSLSPMKTVAPGWLQVEQGLRESLSTMQTSVETGAMALDDLRTPTVIESITTQFIERIATHLINIACAGFLDLCFASTRPRDLPKDKIQRRPDAGLLLLCSPRPMESPPFDIRLYSAARCSLLID